MSKGLIKRNRTIKLADVDVEAIKELSNSLIKKLDISIKTKIFESELHLTISSEADTEEEAKANIKAAVKEIKKSYAANIISNKGEESPEKNLVKLLEKHELSISTVESCTGGLLAARIINVAGASEVFKEGFITYSNKSKRKRVDVSKSTLKKYGAVSRETAREMATGVAFTSSTDIAISITGIAGPDGGTEEKPIGLMYIGIYLDGKVEIEKFIFKGDRQEIREQAVVAAIESTIKYLNSKYV